MKDKTLRDGNIVKVEISTFKDTRFVAVREFWDNEGEETPSRNGISLPPDPDLLDTIASELSELAEQLRSAKKTDKKKTKPALPVKKAKK